MASIDRQGKRWRIRECVSTEKGPRQVLLVSFEGALTPDVLDRADEKASKPVARLELLASARKKGVPVVLERRCPEARSLLAALQRGREIDPTLVGLLRAALERLPEKELPPHLVDAAEWLGRSEADRGHALRGLLRTADRIVRSRGALRERPHEKFPRFSSSGAAG